MLAGAGVWGASTLEQRRKGQETAARLLAAFSNQDDITEQQASAEAQAQLELSRANSYARRAFLQIALANPPDARRLKAREQAFEVSLSQVKSREAHALFEQAILPAVSGSTDPDALREGFALMDRWDIAATLSPAENEKLAGTLVNAMLGAEDTDRIGALAFGVTGVAAFIRPPKAYELASLLVSRSIEDSNASVNDARLPALLALEPRLGDGRAAALAVQLTDHIPQEHNGNKLRTLAMESRGLVDKIDTQAAEAMASDVMSRIAAEMNPGELAPLESVLEPVRDKIGADKARELALQIEPRIILEENTTDLESLLGAWRVLASRVSGDESQPLAAMLLQRMNMPADAVTLGRLTSALAALNAASALRQAGEILIARMRTTANADDLARLASAIAALRKKLPAETTRQATGILVRRMIAEQDSGAIGAMAGALDDLDESLSAQDAAEFAASIAKRMASESNSEALLNLGSGFLALVERAGDEAATGLASPLLARLRNENRATVLRTLAFAIGAMADELDPLQIRDAATKLVTAMTVETDPEALRSLTAGLLAIGGEGEKAGGENFNKAASILAARISLETDFARLHDLAASLHALKGRASPSASQAAAASVAERIANAREAVAVDALGRSLNLIAQDLDGPGSAEIGSMLAARAASETNTNLLRAYGEVLGFLPVGSVNARQLGQLDRMFTIPNAPCEVVTRAKDVDAAELARQILNPLCFEDGWTETVAALGDASKRDLVKGHAAGEAGPPSDFTHLIAKDDDDESSSDSAAGSGAAAHVDFNNLSAVLEPLRPREPLTADSEIPAIAALLLAAGVIFLILAKRKIRH